MPIDFIRVSQTINQHFFLLAHGLIQKFEKFPRFSPPTALVGIAGGSDFAVRAARAGGFRPRLPSPDRG